MLLCSFARRCHQPGSPDEEEPRGRVVQLSFVVATKCRFISGIERTAMEVVQRSRNQNGRERNGKCGIPLSLQEVTVQQRAQAKPRSRNTTTSTRRNDSECWPHNFKWSWIFNFRSTVLKNYCSSACEPCLRLLRANDLPTTRPTNQPTS